MSPARSACLATIYDSVSVCLGSHTVPSLHMANKLPYELVRPHRCLINLLQQSCAVACCAPRHFAYSYICCATGQVGQ